MKYQLLYLPVDKLLTDGCTLLSKDGDIFTFDATTHYALDMSQHRVAEPYLVRYEFNRAIVVGRPSPAVKWLKNRDWVNKAHCFPAFDFIKIQCPTCGSTH